MLSRTRIDLTGGRCPKATTRACRHQLAEGKPGRMLSKVSFCAKAVASTHRNAHAAGLRDAAAMSIMAAEETVRIASKPVEAIIGHKVAQAADFDGYPLPACPASVGTFRAGVRMGYQVAGALSAIPKGLFRGAVRLFSSWR
jgi:hypothetical protein